MKPEQLGKIAKILGGRLEPAEAERVYAGGVCTDTRMLSPGDIFIALEGERDGHNFVMDAYSKGAIAAIVSRDVQIPIPQIIVSDTLEALGNLAMEYRKAIAPRVVAITGSVGKTTAREMIAVALKTRFSVHSAKKNYNNLIGLPLSLLDMKENTEIAVVELGINQSGEIERLVEIAIPDVGVITSVAPVHLEGLGSLDKIAEEKFKLATMISPDAPVFVNADSQVLLDVAKKHERKVITYGIDSDAEFRAENISFEDGRPHFTVGDARFELKLLGRAPIYAALAAVAVAKIFDIPEPIAAEALRTFQPREHRMNLFDCGDIKILDDCYNSSPAALEEALKTMSFIKAKGKIAVLGDMLELGKDEKKYHREVANMLEKYAIDEAILFGKLMKSAFDEARKNGFSDVKLFEDDFAEARDYLLKTVRAGDLILIKGSHSMEMERFVKALVENFCEEDAE
ncbi:UDP-N-acetylmuramoyl-tripeptide--D-alanyl-D-alanine ligase [bacterium]|nr:UDP-N-acetylmuramoyl-tripeptide--D-alanyl-D-alanine ligase [bacterium]